MLLIFQTHPTQYHAPLYRALAQDYHVPLLVVYASDFSVAAYFDRDFNKTFAWDVNLTEGYDFLFLEQSHLGGAKSIAGINCFNLFKPLKIQSPRAVLILGYSPKWYLFSYLRALSFFKPILFRAETTDHAPGHSLNGRQFLKDFFLRIFYSQVSRFLYIGKRSKQHYLRLGVMENKLIFSPYCIDEAFVVARPDEGSKVLRDETRKEIGANSDDYVLMVSGKLIKRKGGDILINAVLSLDLKQRSKIIILFVGDGPLRQNWEAQALTSSVRTFFAGFKNQKELGEYFLASDLMVLPSRYETWGLVVNEALANGVPCIVSDQVGCALDLIETGETGWVFESENAVDLASKISVALHSIANFSLREKCLEKAKEYSLQNAARGIAKAYFESVR